MMECLAEDENVMKQFSSQPLSVQRYFSKWVDSAKTDFTKSDRISKTFFAMKNKMDYGQMLRYFSGKR